MHGWKFISIFFLLSLSLSVSAQDERISTARPGFTDAVEAVPKGIIQIETGLFTNGGKLSGGDQYKLQYNTTAVRIGVFEYTELQIAGGISQAFFKGTGIDSSDGLLSDPIRIGFKSELLKGEGYKPSLAFGSHVNISTDTSLYRPDMQMIFSYPVDEQVTVASMIGLNWLTPNYSTFTWTFKIGINLSQKWAMFGELYGYRNGLIATQAIDGGFLWNNGTFQIDFGGGLGMSREASDWFGNIGLSLMLKPKKEIE